MNEIAQGLALLRKPFDERNIGKLPKPTRTQTDDVKADFRKGVRCDLCHTWHHPDVVHLDYVGHAALTDRLLDADPHWFWEPMAFDPNGLPMRDGYGGLWIRLSVCGHSRIGYGHTDKTGGDAVKETIGDALRNAAMRFGAALDLWHKGELHRSELPEPGAEGDEGAEPPATDWSAKIAECTTLDDLDKLASTLRLKPPKPRSLHKEVRAKWAARRAELEPVKESEVSA